jgi:hypothetical protein
MKESLIQQEYYCSWTSSSETTFIPLDLVAPTVEPAAELLPASYTFEPRILGCDVAYAAKGDKAAICYREGRKVHFLRWFVGKDNMAFAKEIARYIKIVKPHAVFIDYGRGEGVISRLHALGFDHLVIGVHFGGKVYEEGIGNMKALMWVRMRDWFLDSNMPDLTGLDYSLHSNEPVEEQLVKELSTPFMIIDEKQVIKVESKASLKSRGEASPDLAESLSLTFAEVIDADDVVIPAELEALGVTADLLDQMDRRAKEAEYDPLSHMAGLGGANG